ncbi:unnamed protein product [Brugia pahangi]|uniref:Secreted protein n=1 Tax=Brugia pahangi TaxID=6280 RepID=A0A0N4TNS4_BRUPA|nr:unnamed protein product [Brugia pahangi]
MQCMCVCVCVGTESKEWNGAVSEKNKKRARGAERERQWQWLSRATESRSTSFLVSVLLRNTVRSKQRRSNGTTHSAIHLCMAKVVRHIVLGYGNTKIHGRRGSLKG